MAEYRSIPGYSGYRVDDSGNVKSCLSRFGWKSGSTDRWTRSKTWRPLSPEITKRGYLRVVLSGDNGKRQKIPVHILVLTVFEAPRPIGMVACHNDGNKLNNNISNLRWDTAKANIEDERKHGTLALGQRNGNAVLSESDVLTIRKRADSGEPTRVIANLFRVDVGTIRRIVTRKRWVHI